MVRRTWLGAALALVAGVALVLLVLRNGDSTDESVEWGANALDAAASEFARSTEAPPVEHTDAPDSRDARAAVADAGPPAVLSGKPAARVRGRVVDGRRFPAVATVELRRPGAATLNVACQADGAFEIPVLEPYAESERIAQLHARGADGSLCTRVIWLPGKSAAAQYIPPPLEDERDLLDVGTLVLQAGCSLEVVVTDSGRPVSGAAVSVAVTDRAANLAERATTDEHGRARFDGLPAGLVRIAATSESLAASARAFLPEEATLSLALEPTRTFEVEVVDAASGAPIGGARIEVDQRIVLPARFDLDSTSTQEVGTIVRLDREPAITDARGRARLDRLPPDGGCSLAVHAEGFVDLPDPSTMPSRGIELRDPVQTARVELRRAGGRTVRWPIAAGEVPPPPDGSSIELRPAPEMGFRGARAPLAPGRVENGALIADGIDGAPMLLAEAPDGALAVFFAPESGELGEAVSFRRARKIEVLVRDFAGGPLAGAAVTARNQGNNPLCGFVRTGADGIAVLSGLHGKVASVYVVAPGKSDLGTLAGDVDLEQGDGRIEITLPGSFFARVVVRIDGVPRLPGRFVASPPAVEEFPERGELRVGLTATATGRPSTLSIRAEGFLPVSAKLSPAADGSEPTVEFDLARAGELLVDVRRGEDQRVELAIERFDEKAGKWGPDAASRLLSSLRTPNGPRGGFRFAGLGPGRWRAIDRQSGSVSSEAELTATNLRAQVELDVSNEQWVVGRIEVPFGEVASAAVVLVDGMESATARGFVLPGGGPPNGARVAPDGAFRLRIPGDREVTIRPWHAWLVPATGSILTTRVGLSGVVLKLESGRELRIPAQAPMREGATSLRIAAYPGEIGSAPPQWIFAPIFGGVARTSQLAPGRWTLWIDAHKKFAPIVLRDVDVGDGVTTLEPLEMTRGSSLRVRVPAASGGTPPRVFVSAASTTEPKVWRDVNSDGESEVVLPGLGAGRYVVRASVSLDPRGGIEREIEVDGMTDVTIDFGQ